MNDLWTVVLLVAVAIPVFLLLRWLAVRRAVSQTRRRREERGG
ncbi:hypothetical protein [Ornithinimicrobium pekingense]|uniref:Uncharacterized protein n=1 Tax=Ornithinimicrobium pekingense TaxID=384677 RepID=A0ABQ2F5B5_9MICO|nr:hypothetical protein [Ornithinimicrobium pekingense]GGK60594.1 hypothetical protein GCM10011509_06160 [Ornithinimicrobium pekingense]